MAYDEDLANRIRELMAGQRGVTEMKMFGGLAFLIGGNMSVGASGQGGLMVRCDPDDTAKLVAKPHARRFEMRGRAMDGWLRVDAEGVKKVQPSIEIENLRKAFREMRTLTVSIDDIRAAIERRWPRPTAAYRGRADGRPAEAKQTANDSEYDKIRQDADAYRLEQARAILQALGHKENEDGTFSPPSARL